MVESRRIQNELNSDGGSGYSKETIESNGFSQSFDEMEQFLQARQNIHTELSQCP